MNDHTKAPSAVRAVGPAGAARPVHRRGDRPAGRQLQVDRDAPVRGARRLGRHRARARREDAARPHRYHHAWHAELWHKRLPELREMNPDRLTEPPNDEIVAFIDAMTEPEAPELTIEKLVGVYRVLIPHKIAAYTYHLNNTSAITDAPTIRSLEVHPAGRVRGLARRRDADPVAHRDARGSRPGRARQAELEDDVWRPAASPAPVASANTAQEEISRMRKISPAELARDERFVRYHDRGPRSSTPAAPRSRSATPALPSWPPTGPTRPSAPAP